MNYTRSLGNIHSKSFRPITCTTVIGCSDLEFVGSGTIFSNDLEEILRVDGQNTIFYPVFSDTIRCIVSDCVSELIAAQKVVVGSKEQWVPSDCDLVALEIQNFRLLNLGGTRNERERTLHRSWVPRANLVDSYHLSDDKVSHREVVVL